MIWTEELIREFSEMYVKEGKAYCIANLNLSDGQVRSKASSLGLKARGISRAWKENLKEHAKKLTGRKRPEHSELMRAMKKDRRILAIDFTPEARKAISDRQKKRIAEEGHPRGALGMKHTDEAKRSISEKSKLIWSGRTESQIDDWVMKGAKSRATNGTTAPQRIRASWRAAWREFGGQRVFYRSRWEANYGRYLEWLKSSGNIKAWAHEPRTFWFDGIKRGCVSYLPDFHVIESNGCEAYHEVKGWMDDKSKTKIKRMGIYHPTVKLIVIEKKQYREIESKLGRLIEGWEFDGKELLTTRIGELDVSQ